ncbi:uncharacterized protein BO95DRAFT_145147 [Aspergillus brunneoviolaceus CBS 621.78]|uniref:Uncharacterized protein n=1 Tax=Aspergillus brunneoviolaceus CBS 621.78 TaxID=1450534 RepID=A0ACD1G7R5_9EURO|nr:hypothetical protein BO95DRAFT_145147 [Aspergillus brunneoviolaceus CBS 621.78]RAH45275.1 hypothetical protein BO95DRAFT_145147 [Aspergillus brunneoviolaceus CBS 621.78]
MGGPPSIRQLSQNPSRIRHVSLNEPCSFSHPTNASILMNGFSFCISNARQFRLKLLDGQINQAPNSLVLGNLWQGDVETQVPPHSVSHSLGDHRNDHSYELLCSMWVDGEHGFDRLHRPHARVRHGPAVPQFSDHGGSSSRFPNIGGWC